MIKHRSTSFSDYLTLGSYVLLGLILSAVLIVANWAIAKRYGTGGEFLPAWNGSRAFLFEKIDPYSQTVAERTQTVVYGRAARAGEFPYMLDIPFPLLIIYFPLAVIPDLTWARAVFMCLSEVGLLALILLSLRLLEWRPRLWFIVLIFALSSTSIFGISAILDGSPVILITLAIVGAMEAMRSENDEIAGILLALASFHWQAMILLWLMVMLSAYFARRWRVFLGYAMPWVVFGGVAQLIYMSSSGWVLPYLRAVVFNFRADTNLSLVTLLGQLVRGPAEKFLTIIPIALAAILVAEWVGAIRETNSRQFVWTAALTLAIVPFLGLSASIGDLTALVFSVICILPFARERWRRHSNAAMSVFVLAVFYLPSLIHWYFYEDRLMASGLAYLIVTSFAVVGLYWVRWYAVRPPRTWADEVRLELYK